LIIYTEDMYIIESQPSEQAVMSAVEFSVAMAVLISKFRMF